MSEGERAQRIANRVWLLKWQRFRRRVEVVHTERMMRPDALGWRWLYRDLR